MPLYEHTHLHKYICTYIHTYMCPEFRRFLLNVHWCCACMLIAISITLFHCIVFRRSFLCILLLFCCQFLSDSLWLRYRMTQIAVDSCNSNRLPKAFASAEHWWWKRVGKFVLIAHNGNKFRWALKRKAGRARSQALFRWGDKRRT